MRKVILLLVLLSGFNAFVGCCANKQEETDTNIERYLEMKAEVERLKSELEQKDDLIGQLTDEADEFFEREVLGWEEVEPDLKAWSNAVLE